LSSLFWLVGDARGGYRGSCFSFVDVHFSLAIEKFHLGRFSVLPFFTPACELATGLGKVFISGVAVAERDLESLIPHVYSLAHLVSILESNRSLHSNAHAGWRACQFNPVFCIIAD